MAFSDVLDVCYSPPPDLAPASPLRFSPPLLPFSLILSVPFLGGKLNACHICTCVSVLCACNCTLFVGTCLLRLEVNLRCYPSGSIYLIAVVVLDKTFQWAPYSVIWQAGWRAASRHACVSTSSGLRLQIHTTTQGCLHGFQDLNLDPHAYKASSLLMEPCLQSSDPANDLLYKSV